MAAEAKRGASGRTTRGTPATGGRGLLPAFAPSLRLHAFGSLLSPLDFPYAPERRRAALRLVAPCALHPRACHRLRKCAGPSPCAAPRVASAPQPASRLRARRPSAAARRFAWDPVVLKAVLVAALAPRIAVMAEGTAPGSRPALLDAAGQVGGPGSGGARTRIWPPSAWGAWLAHPHLCATPARPLCGPSPRQPVFIHPSSVNHELAVQRFAHPYLVYLESTKTTRVRPADVPKILIQWLGATSGGGGCGGTSCAPLSRRRQRPQRSVVCIFFARQGRRGASLAEAHAGRGGSPCDTLQAATGAPSCCPLLLPPAPPPLPPL
jgi:hypothetical protein